MTEHVISCIMNTYGKHMLVLSLFLDLSITKLSDMHRCDGLARAGERSRNTNVQKQQLVHAPNITRALLRLERTMNSFCH